MKGDELEDALGGVLSRFPQSKEAIRRLFNEDGEIRELCGDYTECLAVLDRLRNGQGATDERFEQYCELRTHLEHELLRRISTRSSSQLPPSGSAAPHDLPSAPSRLSP